MKNNIYIFSDTKLSRKNNTLKIEKIENLNPIHEIDIFEDEKEYVLLPPQRIEGDGNFKYLPIESIEAIYTFGEVSFNSQFLKNMSYYSIPVHFFSYYGKYLGSFIPVEYEGNGEIQISQIKFYLDDFRRLYIAKKIVEGAVKNLLQNLTVFAYRGANIDEEILKISSLLNSIIISTSVQELLGYEGNARNIYYGCWEKIFRKEIDFEKRIKNPPEGIINSLISFGNALLYSVCITEIFRTRLNPYIGFIHEPGDKKHSLAYDISELFKPIIVDRVIFRLINLGMISEKDFIKKDNAFLLKDEPKQKFVEEFERKLSSVVHHKRLNRRLSLRSLIRMECYNLAKFLNGKIKNYEPYSVD